LLRFATLSILLSNLMVSLSSTYASAQPSDTPAIDKCISEGYAPISNGLEADKRGDGKRASIFEEQAARNGFRCSSMERSPVIRLQQRTFAWVQLANAGVTANRTGEYDRSIELSTEVINGTLADSRNPAITVDDRRTDLYTLDGAVEDRFFSRHKIRELLPNEDTSQGTHYPALLKEFQQYPTPPPDSQ
jgi:hypothetical protein